MRNTERIEDLLINASARYGEKPGLISVSDDRCVSFAMWLADSMLFARWLLMRTGDRPGCVSLQAKNSYSYACALFGGFIAGKTMVPLGLKMDSQSLSFVLKDCHPLLGLVDDDLINENSSTPYVEAGCDAVALQYIQEEIKGLSSTSEQTPLLNDSAKASEDIALIIYTSGSTSEPRGVICPHRQILFAVNAINSILGNAPEDVLLCGLPFSFDYGLYQLFLALHSGATLVVSPDFSMPMAIPYWMGKYGVTALPGVPSLFNMLVESNLLSRSRFDQLRYVCSTGDVFSLETILTLKRYLPSCSVFPMYGLTECKRVSILLPHNFIGHEESVGKPLPGTMVTVVDDKGKRLPVNEVGELVVRGPHVMRGYLNNPAATSNRFKYDSETRDTWLFTGDYFRITFDEFLYFEGRGQSFLKVRDQRVSPITLERSLSTLPGIQQVVIVGVKDSLGGDALFAFVRPKHGRQINARTVSDAARNLLPGPLPPKHVHITRDIFPVTQNGKIDRKQLSNIAYRLVEM